MTGLRKMTEHFQRNYIAAQLAKLTPAQQAFYHRIYPNGPDKSQIYNAADIIERTITKNEKNNGLA